MPLFVSLTPEARVTIEEAADWLDARSPGSSARFLDALYAALEEMQNRLLSGLPPQWDADASIYFSRRAYKYRFQTTQRRRNSSAGVWFIFYALADTNGDGETDTVDVLRVRHAAAKPLSEEFDTD